MRAAALFVGLMTWALAGFLLWTGLSMDVTVEGVEIGERIANNHAMHQQAILVQLGIGAGIAGAVFLAAFMIICAMPQDLDEPAQP